MILYVSFNHNYLAKVSSMYFHIRVETSLSEDQVNWKSDSHNTSILSDSGMDFTSNRAPKLFSDIPIVNIIYGSQVSTLIMNRILSH